MSWFGTDIVALGCILGGAAVSGAATLAIMDGGGESYVRCGVEAMAVAPRIAISHGGEARAIVVRPDVRVRSIRDCGSSGLVEIHVDRHMENLDAQLEHLDLQLEVQLEQMEHQLERMEHQFEFELAQEMDVRVQFEEAMSQFEAAKLKVLVERVQGGGN